MRVRTLRKNGPEVVDLNRRKTIREKCLNCSCWVPGEVSNCIFSECSLYPFRSGKGKQNAKERAKAIRKYYLWCMAGNHSEIRKCVSILCPLFAFRLKGIDRAVEINSVDETGHIETVSEVKTGQGILLYG